MTYEFGSAAGGTAVMLAQYPDSGVKSCEDHEYAYLADGSLNLELSSRTYNFALESTSPTSFDLVMSTGDTVATFTKVDGAPPVEACTELSASEKERYTQDPHFDSKLSMFGQTLVFTIEGAPSDALIHPLSSGFSLTQMNARYQVVIAAEDSDTLFAAEFAGGSNTIVKFDPAGDVTSDPLTTAAGDSVRIEAGYFDTRDGLMVAVVDEHGEHLLVTVDPSTLLVTSEEVLLPGVNILDLAVSGTQLLALVDAADPMVVRVGDDGLAEATYKVTGIDGWAKGIAADGPTVYLLSESEGDAIVDTFTL